jgi:hypothetical protein
VNALTAVRAEDAGSNRKIFREPVDLEEWVIEA